MAELPILAQLAKAPTAGHVKKRLQPPLSATQAVDLHMALVEHTVRALGVGETVNYQLWVEGDTSASAFQHCLRLGANALCRQPDGDLGQRMRAICEQALATAPAVILIGSDCPALEHTYLQAALQALHQVDAVLGPALDGGYVLLGLRRCSAELFSGIDWGSELVLAQTLEKLDELGWRYCLLPALADIDRPADLQLLPADLRAGLPAELWA